jgi:uroporphyrinogen-III synthase
MSAKTVLIARAPDGSDDLQKAITDRGFKPLLEPILNIEFLDVSFENISEATPLVFTSGNGVRAFAHGCTQRTNPVYTVGRNTADEARQSGFTNIKTAAGTVDDLVDILPKDCEEVLYVRGEEVSKDLKSIVGIPVRELTAYRSVPADNLSMECLKAIDAKDVAAVMLFSAKGGKVFAGLLEQYDRASRMRTTRVLCISEGVVQSVSVLPFGGNAIADTPDRYGMIKLLDHLKD